MEQTLYSRYEHGWKPVRRISTGWEVISPTTGVVLSVHKTARSLLASLTGHPQGRHWSIARYFKTDTPAETPSIFDIIATMDAPTPSPVLGIDLTKRGHEVRKLLYAGFGRRMYACGHNPDDVLQEVYKGILIRNKGKCPWDARKSSFGHYVHMVISCVLSNYQRKVGKTNEMELMGDAFEDASNAHGGLTDGVQDAVGDLVTYIEKTGHGHLASRIVPLIAAGESRDAIAQKLGVSPATLSRAVVALRKAATAWAA